MSDYTNSVATILPGMGSPSQRQVSFDNNQAAGSATYTLTFAAPGIRKGYARLRTKGSTASPPAAPSTGVTTTSMVVTATGGSTTYVLEAMMGGIGTANQMLDTLIPFNLDINATTIAVTIVTAVGQVYVDFEAAGGA